eukprot:TRINITY_DN20647_c0_g1_i1.p1 TRINITY_DN20647_c0_g1~~TRINITY_DN20647_c0_g1_i1.p1  ORF type:complete len:138 (+),score=11.56 TRINITY_DN20647_c0_g1_i1:199-612(+)
MHEKQRSRRSSQSGLGTRDGGNLLEIHAKPEMLLSYDCVVFYDSLESCHLGTALGNYFHVHGGSALPPSRRSPAGKSGGPWVWMVSLRTISGQMARCKKTWLCGPFLVRVARRSRSSCSNRRYCGRCSFELTHLCRF